MTALRVIVDQVLAPVPGGIGRYAEELTRALIETAPDDVTVEGIVSASTDAQYEELERRIPGLARLYKSPLARRELAAAWQHGFTLLPGKGMVHATSVLAPLYRHERGTGNQTAVTVHDVVPWTNPETLTPRGVSWHKAMVARAYKYADAVVVPTHAVADELAEFYDFGERVRVIGGAVSARLALPIDAEARAIELDLPPRYLLAVGTLEPRKGLEPLIRSLALPQTGDIPLLIVGPAGWGDVDVAALAASAGLAEGRVRTLGRLSDAEVAVALSRASAFVFPSLAEGFGLPVLEAMSLGAPVIHSDSPAVLEVAADAGVVVARDDAAGYPERLADAIARVLDDEELAARLRLQGIDRSHAFSWRASAEKVWQLHADL
ncbi:glycosyltransferase family 4 protein [Galbitalea soli]|uniref:Glycosyltransferase family 4 protein n=1 Tax=Galbitalea soli TaxID=1268042 RepID=A0A7C9PNC8_9MICO|nr:glycosyltransferase family 1 protein [Galbitalea soli]NEM91328.1 glycosyltransferase family 4 protein [Galbitalea soli]NYJ30018.1 glycosyltransferase involved in cell wall biosynthesis [Galbitalea soli]